MTTPFTPLTKTDLVDALSNYFTNSTYSTVSSTGVKQYGEISTWDVSNITDMANLFSNTSFNQDITSWDVSNVTSFYYMFWNATSFNQPIGSWNVSKVTTMTFMFCGAGVFNQDISGWDVSSVTNMNSMFWGADSFNQNIRYWNTSNVTNFGMMFAYADAMEATYTGTPGFGSTPTQEFFNMSFTFNLNDLRNIFKTRSSSDPKLPYNTGFLSNGQDLTELYYPYTANNYASNTNYLVNSTDLSTLFQDINQSLYGPFNKSTNLSSTNIIANGFTAYILENTGGLGSTATCNINFSSSISSINVLVVGGGGGGACGNYWDCAGGGGGGSGIVYHENLSINPGDTFDIVVGAGGSGKKTSNAGQGNSAGSPGAHSSFTSSDGSSVQFYTMDTIYSGTSTRGNQGLGIGANYFGGGLGGSAFNNLSNSGGGGGGGGGASMLYPTNINNTPSYAPSHSGAYGYLNTIGTNSSSSTAKSTNGNVAYANNNYGGNGGSSYFDSGIRLPFTDGYCYCGNGGGGGCSEEKYSTSTKAGGKAGSQTGGAGGDNNSDWSSTNGQDATSGLSSGNYYYGNGGGGGSCNWAAGNTGGSGSNGVVMVWFQTSS